MASISHRASFSENISINYSGETGLVLSHYTIGAILLAVYGVYVCPFIDSLSTVHLVSPIVATFCIMFLVRAKLASAVTIKVGLDKRVSSALKRDVLIFVIAGVLLALYNYLIFSFPLESGIKVIVGMFCLSWFVSADLALDQEYYIADQLKKSGQHLERTSEYFPLSKKFTLLTLTSLLIVSVVMLLVVRKELYWIGENLNNIDIVDMQKSIMFEFIFVLCVLFAYVFKIISGYSRNAAFYLHNQNSVLQTVSEGNLNTVVPVASNDEFGVMAELTNKMIKDLAAQKIALQVTRDTVIIAMSTLAETRDNETGAHILRTQAYVKTLAIELSKKQKYASFLNEEMIDLLFKSAPLHDIGKVGIPDAILLKPGKLTDEEFTIMKTHATLGVEALQIAGDNLGENSFLEFAQEIAGSHHEKWDGSGYPNALSGENIPLSGRLMAVADVYDALITKRVYKPAFTHDKAKGIIIDGKGKHFDPEIIDVFIAVENEFILIAEQFKDTK